MRFGGLCALRAGNSWRRYRTKIGIEMKKESGSRVVAFVEPAHSLRPTIRKGVEIDFQLNLITLTSCFDRSLFRRRWFCLSVCRLHSGGRRSKQQYRD